MTVPFNVNLPIVTTGRIGDSRKLHVIVGQRPLIVEIEELPASEVLIAAEFPDSPHVRAFAGQFYRRLADRTVAAGQHWLDADQHCIMQFLNFEYTKNRLMYNYKERLVVLEGHGDLDRPRPLGDIDREKIRSRDDILIGQQISDFEALVRRLRVIGDAIYLHCDEPHLVIQSHCNNENAYSLELKEKMAKTPYADFSQIAGFYPLTQFDRALSRMRSLSKLGYYIQPVSDHGNTTCGFYFTGQR